MDKATLIKVQSGTVHMTFPLLLLYQNVIVTLADLLLSLSLLLIYCWGCVASVLAAAALQVLGDSLARQCNIKACILRLKGFCHRGLGFQQLLKLICWQIDALLARHLLTIFLHKHNQQRAGSFTLVDTHLRSKTTESMTNKAALQSLRTMTYMLSLPIYCEFVIMC